MSQPKLKTRPADARQNLVGKSLSETARSVVSILLFVHLFVIFVCLSANLSPSALQQRLLGVFEPYAELLNFDIGGTRLFLTHGSVRDVDHGIDVLRPSAGNSEAEEWESISRGIRGGERRHRYQRLADTLAAFQEDEETAALIASGVARSYVDTAGQTVAQIRCRQHTLQSWAAVDSPVATARNPNSSSYFTTVYRANVLTLEPGQIGILKRNDAALEATPTRQAGRNGPFQGTPKTNGKPESGTTPLP